ncbi:hypothetical protein CHUAL_008051 [Chamberlinius hualienensis]
MGNTFKKKPQECVNQCSNLFPDVIVYCFQCLGTLPTFLADFLPVDLVNNKKQFLMIINPTLSIAEVQLQYLEKPSDNIVSYFNRHHRLWGNYRLLDLILLSGIKSGYWLILCRDNRTMAKFWRRLAVDFYTGKIRFKYIACNRRLSGGGYLYLVNEDFRNITVVKEMVNSMKTIIAPEFDLVPPMIYYIPTMFSHLKISYGKNCSGMYVDNYLYSFSFVDGAFYYADEVEDWLKLHEMPYTYICYSISLSIL